MIEKEIDKLIKVVEWEIKQFERPSVKNSIKMLNIIKSERQQSPKISENNESEALSIADVRRSFWRE